MEKKYQKVRKNVILDIFLFRFFAYKGETRVKKIRWKIYLARVKANSRKINARKMRVDCIKINFAESLRVAYVNDGEKK